MGLFSKKPITKANFKKVETNTFFTLELLEDKLQIGLPLAKPDQVQTLRYEQIKDVVYTSDIQKVSKSKSPIGRAVAGGLLFGGVGAVVGAVSGTTTKTKNEYHFYVIINYTSKDGEEKFLQYEDMSTINGKKFIDELKNRCNITAPEFDNEL